MSRGARPEDRFLHVGIFLLLGVIAALLLCGDAQHEIAVGITAMSRRPW